MNFEQVERLIQQSRQPLADDWLEGLEKNPERRNYYRFLYHLIRTRQPAVALEIGVEYGLASAHLVAAAATYGGQVIGVDHNFHGFPGGELARLFANYHYLVMDSRQAFPAVASIVKQYGRLGVVFQDSSHHWAESCDEWEMYSQLLDAGAVWVCDDITPAFHDPKLDPPGLGMVQYFDSRPGDKRLYRDVLHYGNAQGVILLNGAMNE